MAFMFHRNTSLFGISYCIGAMNMRHKLPRREGIWMKAYDKGRRTGQFLTQKIRTQLRTIRRKK